MLQSYKLWPLKASQPTWFAGLYEISVVYLPLLFKLCMQVFLLAVVNDLLNGLYVTIKDQTKTTAGFIDSFNVDGPILR